MREKNKKRKGREGYKGAENYIKSKTIELGKFYRKYGHSCPLKENISLFDYKDKTLYKRAVGELSKKDIEFQNKHWNFDEEYYFFKEAFDSCPNKRKSKGRKKKLVFLEKKDKLTKMIYFDRRRSLSRNGKTKRQTKAVQLAIEIAHKTKWFVPVNTQFKENGKWIPITKITSGNIIQIAKGTIKSAKKRVNMEKEYSYIFCDENNKRYPRNRKYHNESYYKAMYGKGSKVVRKPRIKKLGKVLVDWVDIINLMHKQQGRDYYDKKLKMVIPRCEFGTKQKDNRVVCWDSMTLDRKNSNKTYTKDNVVLSTYATNTKRGAITPKLAFNCSLDYIKSNMCSKRDRRLLLSELNKANKSK